MNCQAVIELMQRYLDQDLNQIQYKHMLNHVHDCPECAKLFQRLLNVSEQLESLPKVTPAFSLVDAILPKLQWSDTAPVPSATGEGLVVNAAVQSGMSSSAQSELAAASIQAAYPNTAPRSRMAAWHSWTRELISAKIMGAVVAVSLVIGLLIFNLQTPSKLNHADSAKVDVKSTATNSASASEKSSAPADSGLSELQGPALAAVPPEDSGNTVESQQEGSNATRAANELVPPSNAAGSTRTATPTLHLGSNKIGGAVPQGSSSSTAAVDSSIMAAPSSVGGALQQSASAPLQASAADGLLKEPRTYGAQPKAGSPTGNAFVPQSDSLRSNSEAPDMAAPVSFGSRTGSVSTLDRNAGAWLGEPAKQGTLMATSPNDSSAAKSQSGAASTANLGGSSPKISPSSLAATDKAYTATINGKRVVISDKKGSRIFTSGNEATDTEQITLIEWTVDYKLTYQISNQTGTRTFVIHAVNRTEAAK